MVKNLLCGDSVFEYRNVFMMWSPLYVADTRSMDKNRLHSGLSIGKEVDRDMKGDNLGFEGARMITLSGINP